MASCKDCLETIIMCLMAGVACSYGSYWIGRIKERLLMKQPTSSELNKQN